MKKLENNNIKNKKEIEKRIKEEKIEKDPKYYVVQWGDTFEKIASENDTTERELIDLNKTDVIYQGQIIRIK